MTKWRLTKVYINLNIKETMKNIKIEGNTEYTQSFF